MGVASVKGNTAIEVVKTWTTHKDMCLWSTRDTAKNAGEVQRRWVHHA